jgi:hypothetical protein
MIPDGSSAHKFLALMNLPKPKAREPSFLDQLDCRYLSKTVLQAMISDINAVLDRQRAQYQPRSPNLAHTLDQLQAELAARRPVELGTFAAPGVL